MPLVWVPTAIRNFEHCGDEYGGFLLGSLPAFWMGPFLSAMSINSPKTMMPPLIVAGALTVLAAGAILDLLRVRWSIWFALWIIIALSFFAQWFGGFPSVERALAKNGSYDTYVVTCTNLGLWLATAVCLIGGSVYRLGLWSWRRAEPGDGGATCKSP